MKKNKSKNQKTAFFFLLILAFSAIFLGFYELYQNVYHFSAKFPQGKSLTEKEEESQMRALNYIMSLHKKDTDQDGLSDYDEMYNYKTSPYLYDSDGDKIGDKEELEQGSDPLCHQDKNCETEVIVPTQEVESGLAQTPELLNNQAEAQIQPFNLEESSNALKNLSISPEDITATQLRQMLEQAGFPQEQLDSYSDQDLMNRWQETIKASE